MKIIDKDNLFVEITFPKLLLHHKLDGRCDIDIECGPYLTELDTGIYFCKYDYGRIIKIQFLGLGIYVWWLT